VLGSFSSVGISHRQYIAMAAYCYSLGGVVVVSVGWSVGHDRTISPAKTAELIKMPFGGDST